MLLGARRRTLLISTIVFEGSRETATRAHLTLAPPDAFKPEPSVGVADYWPEVRNGV